MRVRSCLAALVFALATQALADVITMKDGRVVEGEITQEDATTLKVKLKAGSMTLDPKDVASIERKPTAEQEYKGRLAKADAKSASSQLDLGLWAGGRGLDAECVAHCRNAWKLDPALSAAVTELEKRDYHLVNGEWQDPDTYYPAKGYLKLDGKWLAPLEHAWRLIGKDVAKFAAAKKSAEAVVAASYAKKKQNEDQIAADQKRLPGLEKELEEATAERDVAWGAHQSIGTELILAKNDLASLEKSSNAKDPDNQKAIKEMKKSVSALESKAKKTKGPFDAAEKKRTTIQNEKLAIKDRGERLAATIITIERAITEAEGLATVAGDSLKAAQEREAEAKAKWDKANK